MIHALLTLAGSLLVYFNSLNGGFAFDDHRAILENPDLQPEERSLWQLLNNDFWGGSMTREVSHKSYRPLTVLSYRYLNYAISELHPFSYHFVNVLLHGVVCVLFLFLCRIILGRGTWSLFSALLFAVHSVHTEAVSVVTDSIVACLTSYVYRWLMWLGELNFFAASSFSSLFFPTTLPSTKDHPF